VQDEPTLHADRELTEHELNGRGATLEQLADLVAERYPVARRRGGEYPLPRYLEQLEATLDEAYQQFASDTQLSLSFAGEWLLDNFYIIQEAMQEVREDMPKGYYRQLPKLAGMATANAAPRVYMLAREIIYYSSSYLVFDQVEQFLAMYQRKAPLTIAEIWALPIMLRLGILENLAQAVAFLRDIAPPTSEVFTARLTPEEQVEERTVSNCVLSLPASMHGWISRRATGTVRLSKSWRWMPHTKKSAWRRKRAGWRQRARPNDSARNTWATIS